MLFEPTFVVCARKMEDVLIEMGFPPDRCQRAAQLSNGNPGKAMELLLAWRMEDEQAQRETNAVPATNLNARPTKQVDAKETQRHLQMMSIRAQQRDNEDLLNKIKVGKAISSSACVLTTFSFA